MAERGFCPEPAFLPPCGSRLYRIGINGGFIAILAIILIYSILFAAGIAISHLYYIPLVAIAVWYSNRSIWTAAALSIAYAMVTLYLALGGYILDPVMIFLFTLLYLWGMTAVTLFQPRGFQDMTRSTRNNPAFTLDRSSLMITSATPAFATLLGYTREALEGTDIGRIWTSDRDRQAFCGMLGRGVEVRNFETVLTGTAGNAVPVLLAGRPDQMEHSCSALDLSSLASYRAARMGEEEAARKIAVEETWRQDFVTTAAHELRTPLQPVLGYLHLLLEDRERYGIGDDAGRLLKICLDNVHRERIIVNRMLELSLLDSGKVACATEQVHLHGLVCEVLAHHDIGSTAEVCLDIPGDTCISVNREQFFLVLESLVLNAVQYNEPPRRIELRYQEDEDYQAIIVRDNGIGIEPEKLEAIFKPFYLADEQDLSRDYDRMGLGLPIAERYVRLNGGTIAVESRIGEGSTFTVVLQKRGGDGT
jgi:signal transduction histidine kinase